MQLLEEFIDQHYIGYERTEVLELLNKYELDTILDQLLIAHKHALMVAGSLTPEQVMPLASSYSNMALAAIKSKTGLINQGDEKKTIMRAIVQMGLRLYLSFVRQFPEEMIEIMAEIKESLPTICQAIHYDYNEFKQHFNIEQIEIVIKDVVIYNDKKRLDIS